MPTGVASRIHDFFEAQAGDSLRSVLSYDSEDYELQFLRDDVAEEYSRDEIEDAVEDLRMESFTAPIQAKTYAEDHGDVLCLAVCFEHVIEMNIVLDDAVGVAVGLDADAMSEARGLIGNAHTIASEERIGESSRSDRS